ncbi:MAG: DUF72 domain-containing protein [Candidatus Omnitrophica bacterium]|nr:DUF72 domain-containing protein [Candidatus Omnitrophota bacterium]
MCKAFVGTSGWNYPHWSDGVFYPSGLSQNKWLEYYARFFNSVELNVTFYRLVHKKTFEGWYKRTSKEFYFAVKGWRFITHIKKLKIVDKSLRLFFDSAYELREKLAVVLWQFPAGFKKDIDRLEVFLKLLKKTKVAQAFEFRNESWFNNDVYNLLKEYNACLCVAHSDYFPCVREITTDFLYLRFHGRETLYNYNYSDKELKEWAEFAKNSKVKEVFTFFNNDAHGYAVKNALKFKELLGG